MTEWLKPRIEIIKHPYTIIHYWYEYDDNGVMSKGDDVDIFYFDNIGNTFISRGSRNI